MSEYAPQADKLPPDVAEQAARISEVVAAVKKQISPDGGWLSDGPLHLEKLEEPSADNHNPRFTDADDFWKNGMDPSQDGSDTSEKLFVNNFWQYFFPDEMFKGDLLEPTVLNKPPRKLLKEAGGELLTSVQQLVKSTLPILRRQCLCSMCWHYIRLLNKMLLRLGAQVRMSIYACRSLI
ncbi:hypothetical protein HG434_003615 [Candidatus Saccharibacteria bacterium]|nr:hypothetical protein [Candidatus Saccharibacteria bacterium]